MNEGECGVTGSFLLGGAERGDAGRRGLVGNKLGCAGKDGDGYENEHPDERPKYIIHTHAPNFANKAYSTPLVKQLLVNCYRGALVEGMRIAEREMREGRKEEKLHQGEEVVSECETELELKTQGNAGVGESNARARLNVMGGMNGMNRDATEDIPMTPTPFTPSTTVPFPPLPTEPPSYSLHTKTSSPSTSQGKQGIHLALPCISTGSKSFPHRLAARIAVTTVRDFLRHPVFGPKRRKMIRKVSFCVWPVDSPNRRALQVVFGGLFVPPGVGGGGGTGRGRGLGMEKEGKRVGVEREREKGRRDGKGEREKMERGGRREMEGVGEKIESNKKKERLDGRWVRTQSVWEVESVEGVEEGGIIRDRGIDEMMEEGSRVKNEKECEIEIEVEAKQKGEGENKEWEKENKGNEEEDEGNQAGEEDDISKCQEMTMDIENDEENENDTALPEIIITPPLSSLPGIADGEPLQRFGMGLGMGMAMDPSRHVEWDKVGSGGLREWLGEELGGERKGGEEGQEGVMGGGEDVGKDVGKRGKLTYRQKKKKQGQRLAFVMRQRREREREREKGKVETGEERGWRGRLGKKEGRVGSRRMGNEE